MCFYDVTRSTLRASRKCTDTHPVNSISYHPGAEILLAATAHPALHIYDVKTFRCFLSPSEGEHHAAPITKATWAANGAYFASCSADTIKVWDGGTCRCFRTLAGAHEGAMVTSITFSSNGAHLLSTGGDSCVRLWDVGTGRLVSTYEGAVLQSSRATCCFSHDEAHIVCTDDATASILVWSTQTGQMVQRCMGHVRPLSSLSHSPSHAAFLSCSDDGQMRIWTADI